MRRKLARLLIALAQRLHPAPQVVLQDGHGCITTDRMLSQDERDSMVLAYRCATGQASDQECGEYFSRYGYTTPEFCPGSGDPRCKGECTVNQVTGKIKDPDCFR